jgi:hypothetical protein
VEQKDTVRAGDDGTTPTKEKEEEEEGHEETNTGSS